MFDGKVGAACQGQGQRPRENLGILKLEVCMEAKADNYSPE